MSQLSDDQALDYIRKARSAGVSEQRIKEVLSQEYAAPEYESQIAGQTGTSYQPFTQQNVTQNLAETKSGMKKAAGAGIVAGLSYLGGLPAAALAPEGWGVLAGVGGQTAGAYGGTLLKQKLFGEPMNQGEARSNALWTAVPGLATYGATKVLGAAGGVPSAASEYVGAKSKVVPRYDLTMVEPKPTAELNLGRDVKKAVVGNSGVTAGRIAEKGFIDEATQAGKLVDPQPTIDILNSKMLKTPKTAAGRNYNKKLIDLRNSLEATKARGGMTPAEADELIGGELDPSIYSGGKPSSKLTSKAMIPTRQSATQSLLSSMPPEAALARTQAAQELSRRELATSYFGGSEKQVTNNIRNLFKPGNEGMLESLQGVSEASGMDFVKMAQELNVKRVFNADDRVKAGILHRIMLSLAAVGVASGKPGYAAAAVLSQPAAARFGAKVMAPLQMLAGPTGALMAQKYRGSYPLSRKEPQIVSPSSKTAEHGATAWKETKISPEQMFPGTTNAPPQEAP